MLSGCATQINSPQESANGTSMSYDRYLGVYTVSGKTMDTGEFPNITQFWLVGGFGKNLPSDTFQLYVHHWSQTGWLFLDSASDGDATLLPVTVLKRTVGDVGGDDVSESLIITLSKEYLIAHQSSGLDIRLVGSGGSLFVEANGFYVQGFLQKFNQVRLGI